MKNYKKPIALLIATAALVGSTSAAFAAEDIPPQPGYGPEWLRDSQLQSQPQQEPQAPVVENPEVAAPPIYSMEDYEEMHDAIANPTGRIDNSPALGARYGRGVVIAGSVEVDEEYEYENEDGSVTVAEANASTDQPVAAAQSNSTATTPEKDVADADKAPEETTGNASNDAAKMNPNTGAASMALPLVMAAAALGTAPIVLKKKK